MCDAKDISDCIDSYVEKAKKSWPNKLRDWNKPFWCFNLNNTTAGLAFYIANKIHLNHRLFLQNKQDFFSQTIPHEVAHLVAFRVFGESAMGHGPEWKSVMRVFGVAPERCHNYDVSSVKRMRTITRFLFTCNCSGKVFELTPTQSKKADRDNNFSCRVCESKLVRTNKKKTWVQ
jgi:SprT protein